MRIRMVTTAAGPSGVWMAGSERVVDRETGETLVRYGFADVVDAGELRPDGREVAAATPAVERAVDPVAVTRPKRRTRKSAEK